MSFPEEFEGHVGVCDDRAALLLYCLVDYARALDVSGLSFAYAEDAGDALDSVYESRRVVLCLLAASEGFLYGLVDYLRELCYGEVDDPCVLMYHVVSCFDWQPEKGSNLRRPRVAWSMLLSRGSAC